MLGLRSAALVSFVTLLFSIGGSVGMLDKSFGNIQVCCSQEVQAASSRCLHATLSSSSTTPVVKDPMPDSSGEGRVRLPEREGT